MASRIPNKKWSRSLMETPCPNYRGVQPLLLPNVVRNVMKFLQVRELQKCRRVCRVWRYESGYHLRTRPMIVELWDYRDISKYIDYMKHVADIPHSHFQFHSSYLECPSWVFRTFFHLVREHITNVYLQRPVVWSDLYLILTRYTSTIRHLRLDYLPRDDTPKYRRIFDQLCPSLKNVEFSESTFNSTSLNPQRLAGLNNLFNCAPNIETLGFQLNPCDHTLSSIKSIREAERRFADIILNSSPHILKKLIDTGIVWNDTDLEILTERNFPLRNFKIMDSDVSVKGNLQLKEFFFKIESTLMNLTYTNAGPSDTMSRCCVHLENLKNLTLISFFGSLLFVDKLRALKSLTLLEVDFDRIEIPPNGLKSTIAHNLRTLKISIRPGPESEPTFNPDCIYAFTTYFRSLRVLHLNKVTDAGIRIIFKEMCSTLEELKLYDSHITDEGITGLPAESVKQISSSLVVDGIEPLRIKMSKLTRVPNIGDLQRMKKFTLEIVRGAGSSNKPVAGDIGFLFGVALCTGLVEICLENWNLTDISLKSLAQRDLRVHLTRLDVSKCRNFTTEGRNYLKKNFLGPLLILRPPVNLKSLSFVSDYVDAR